eukprot:TRINITY_DN12833_c0_g1_i1.p1 TRINITY_DN12833_c0_g1~~TRINITY_DN12833_c0_g1_i1.p1  ORF type:complete len:441 (+),score=106.49 TRINITY_DN12833_c0_g1_i1:41-1324(+)
MTNWDLRDLTNQEKSLLIGERMNYKDVWISLENAGVTKAKTSWYRLVVMSIFAGIMVSWGAGSSISLGAGFYSIGELGFARWMLAVSFPFGLCIIILVGAELFTGDCMTLLVPIYTRRIKWYGLFKVWLIAYFGNFVGSIANTYFLYWLSGIYKPPGILPDYANVIATAKNNLNFGETFLRGIGANFLVCLAVVMACSGTTVAGKVLGAYIPIYVFAGIGFEHSIANMTFLFLGVLNDLFEFGRYLYLLIPSTLGNIVGGTGLCAAVYLWYHKFYEYGRLRGDHWGGPPTPPTVISPGHGVREVVHHYHHHHYHGDMGNDEEITNRIAEQSILMSQENDNTSQSNVAVNSLSPTPEFANTANNNVIVDNEEQMQEQEHYDTVENSQIQDEEEQETSHNDQDQDQLEQAQETLDATVLEPEDEENYEG